MGIVLLGALGGCKGGEGEGCNSTGILGTVYCDQALICNTADGYTCEGPGSRQQNQSCSSNDLCATGLWCDGISQRCVPWLHEGDPCNDPFSWYGHDGDGNPPAAANAVVPDSGTVRFDFSLVLR
jgi:hypothetical protein